MTPLRWAEKPLRFESRDERDQRAMTDWVIGQIEQRNEEPRDYSDEYTVEDYEIDLARAGNPEPLRERYPQFADLIVPPKRRKGKRKQYDRDEVMAGAEELVRFVKALWWREYKKKRRTTQPSAVDIVAEYLRFDHKLTADLMGYDEKATEKLYERVRRKSKRPLIAR